MPLSKEQIATGYRRFLAEHPDVRARVDAITTRDAEIVGVDLDELRSAEIGRCLQSAADADGEDGFEYLVELAVDSAEERQALYAERDASVRGALGL
jgi:hypothetical protein